MRRKDAYPIDFSTGYNIVTTRGTVLAFLPKTLQGVGDKHLCFHFTNEETEAQIFP